MRNQKEEQLASQNEMMGMPIENTNRNNKYRNVINENSNQWGNSKSENKE